MNISSFRGAQDALGRFWRDYDDVILLSGKSLKQKVFKQNPPKREGFLIIRVPS